MDLLGGGRRKKILIVSSVSLVTLLGVSSLGFYVFNTKHTNKQYKPQVTSKPVVNSNVQQPKNTNTYTPPKTTPTVTVTESGSKASFSNSGTYGVLSVKSNGSVNKYAVYPNTLVFDANLEEVVYPSSVSSSKRVRVFVTTRQDGSVTYIDPNVRLKPATAVILNDTGNVTYGQVSGVQQVGSGIDIFDNTSKTIYHLFSNTQIENAYSDNPIEPSSLAVGDQLFVYIGKPTGSAVNVSAWNTPIGGNQSTISNIEANNNLQSQKQMQSNFQPSSTPLPKGYKVVDVSSLYVNQVNQ